MSSIDRIPDMRYAEAIRRARNVIGSRVLDVIGPVRFVCGVDPRFAGLHQYSNASLGRSYGDTMHCCYPRHLTRPASERVTTIVIPTPNPAWQIVHELGHALDYRLGLTHAAVPVTDYAKTDRGEAFAEAFTAWHYQYGDQDAANTDRPTVALFAALSR